MSTAIRADGVAVRRGKHDIVQGASFSWESGRVHALLGHNGAGKTTLLKALCGQIGLHSGHVVAAFQPHLLHDGLRFPRELTVKSLLDHSAALFNADSMRDEVVSEFRLDRFLTTPRLRSFIWDATTCGASAVCDA